MSLLKRKIDLNRRARSSSEDPRLAGSLLAAIKAVLPDWIGEEGWSIRDNRSQWVKSRELTPDGAPEIFHLYREDAAVLMVGVNNAAALRASAFALGVDPADTSRPVGAFERHHARRLTEAVWFGLTGRDWDREDGGWDRVEGLSPVPFANGPEGLLRLDVTLAREETEGDFNLVLLAQSIPLPEPVEAVEPLEPEAETAEAELEIDDLKDRLGPCRLSVHVVGEQIELSVADCTRLEIGQVLDLPRLRFDDVALRLVSGGRQRDLARGTLGMDSGRKAVKLHNAPDPDFFAQADDFVDEAGPVQAASTSRDRPASPTAQPPVPTQAPARQSNV